MDPPRHSQDLKRSFPPNVDGDTRLLVLGSLPGERSLAEQRYYAHPQNGFWVLMSGVIGRDLVALDYEARLDRLLEHGVGLWDVVASARRTGSSDATIRDLSVNDLGALVRSLPRLCAIGFNGGTAARHGMRALGVVPEGVETMTLPSSSPLHTIPLAAKQAEWDRMRTFLKG